MSAWPHRRITPDCVIPLVLGAVLAMICTASAQIPAFNAGLPVGTNQNTAIPEVSGLSASRQNPHVLWVHNDSSRPNALYALNPQGQLHGTYPVTNAANIDWEDMALAKDPATGIDYLYIGDIGDNLANRANIQIYRVPEPLVNTNLFNITNNLAATEKYVLTYPDGARDAETLIVDPWTGDIFITTKYDNPAHVYQAPYPQTTNSTIIMNRTNDLSVITATTGGDISHSGWQTVIKTPISVHYFPRYSGQPLADSLTNAWILLPYTIETQGEAICWQSREEGYYTLSENVNEPVYWYAAQDTDNDGLVDSAEVAYRTDMTNPDSDADGQIDGDEVTAGTDPTNGISFFALTGITQSNSLACFQWFARSNRQYDVQSAPGTNINTFTTYLSGISVSTDQMMTTNIPAAESQFIRLRVRDASGW